eukprot:TRINITY_DN942_c0_g2_i1.p1 TRINITY_DN942_c0_g2~~TRINITY_DN942_c0_g2_i1.p1  ORF type:complete len:451 (+),score=164.16 TRINITY_DN942_c0_g2_i1:125-1354(+)
MSLARYARRKVSLKKKRFTQDGFDLDLSYITDQIICMGFPSIGMESIYRNPRSEVKRFFERKHSGKYKVYNLCGESGRHYDASEFKGRVGYFPFFDHQAPPIELMGQFCRDVDEWLKSDSKNVVAIHCKAGKGRAGTMACCYLVHAKLVGTEGTATEAMEHYAKARTHNSQGITIPSQKRYINYYQDIRDYGLPPVFPTIKIKTVTIATSKYIRPDKSKPHLEILKGGTEVIFESPVQSGAKEGKDTVIDCKDTEVSGDVKIVIYDEGISKGQEVSHFWFNTSFISNNKLELKRAEIDKAWGDKKFKIFSQEFNITVVFEGAEVSAMDKLKAEANGKSKEEHKTEVKVIPSEEEGEGSSNVAAVNTKVTATTNNTTTTPAHQEVKPEEKDEEKLEKTEKEEEKSNGVEA